ncbi:PREDICTED: MLX-interacting protein [Ceratosolen solmsi marchali]|uniref:MLX-interacting protein n=1 Tax=Ceratosolen solmsi marchali TaxID=326594 RepID=A0AAJ7E0Q8_9HYME|nr:PREDICTED: MLX-interacting protein [Ceratosolen solmsi marchali]
MQAELIHCKNTDMTTSRQELVQIDTRDNDSVHQSRLKRECSGSRETIHSGHFMVSDFEAEAQDDEDELAVPVPDDEIARLAIIGPIDFSFERFVTSSALENSQQLSIETSLNKLFQCMSLAYRQKLTSPKWNRFKGIRLRWKDKIRLNNVIWRCWHMQFILKQNTLVCQFASPLDVDTHNKPEAVVLEGKYWKRKLAAVTAEYKKWRMFYRNKILGWTNKDGNNLLESMDTLEWGGDIGSSDMYGIGVESSCNGVSVIPSGDGVHNMMVDEDYMELMTDTLFSTISCNQPLYFPDPREIARGANLADFIQPSLGPLQPNLEDFIDTLEPFQEFLSSRLPPVPEEDVFHNASLNNYPELDLIVPLNEMNNMTETSIMPVIPNTHPVHMNDQTTTLQNHQYAGKIFTEPEQDTIGVFRNNVEVSENFNILNQQNHEQQIQIIRPIREKQMHQSRSSLRSSRIASQQQQQQQTYQTNATQQQTQHSPYQVSQDYTMDIQTNTSEQLQLVIPNSSNQHVQTLIAHQQQQQQEEQQQQQQLSQQTQKQIQSIISTKPYINIANQSYKFPSPMSTFDTQQCKFTSNNIKTLPDQSVLAVTNQQPLQPQVVSCKTAEIDLAAPALHPTKLRPRFSTAPIPAATASSVNNKEEIFAVPKYQMKLRNRSRSSSSVLAPRMHPPSLISAISDPALNLNSNVLLANLLKNSTSNLYTMNSRSEKIVTQPVVSVKHILPMLPSTQLPGLQMTNTTHHITAPVTVQTIHTTANVQNRVQQQQASSNQQILLQTESKQVKNNAPNSPKDSSNTYSSSGHSLSPLHSPMSIGGPLSPNRSYMKIEPERGQYKEQRRVGHIHAEQKRRYNIKNGFDMLYSLIPQLSQSPNTKMSKAAMLQKGADYIRLLRSERLQLKDEMDKLRSQVDSLNTAINNCQAMLPATGAPISRQRTNKMKEMFDEYVRLRTRDNWKFWIFSILLEPLMVSFNTSVSTSSIEDLYRTTILWVEQHCSLVDLRPAVLNSLRYLCTATDILNDPSRLPEEALSAINQKERRKSMQ